MALPHQLSQRRYEKVIKGNYTVPEKLEMAEIYYNLSRSYYFEKNYSTAKEIFPKVLAFLEAQNNPAYNGDIAKVINMLAYCHLHTGNAEEALATIEKAIKLMPEEAYWYDSRGEILLALDRVDEAVEMWKKVVEMRPDFDRDLSDLYKKLKEMKAI